MAEFEDGCEAESRIVSAPASAEESSPPIREEATPEIKTEASGESAAEASPQATQEPPLEIHEESALEAASAAHPVVEPSKEETAVSPEALEQKQPEYAAAAPDSFYDVLRAFAAESRQYSRKSFESASCFAQRFFGATSFERLVQIQSEYARNSSTDFLAHVTKMGELYSQLSKRPSTLAKRAGAKE